MNNDTTPQILLRNYIEQRDFLSFILLIPILIYFRIFKGGPSGKLLRKKMAPDHVALAQNFLANMQNMHSVCKGKNITFFAVLQPFNGAGKRKLTDSDNILLTVLKKDIIYKNQSRFDFYLDYYNSIRQNEVQSFFRDFTPVFDHEMGQIYFDTVHFSDKGQRIVANALYDLIEEEYRK